MLVCAFVLALATLALGPASHPRSAAAGNAATIAVDLDVNAPGVQTTITRSSSAVEIVMDVVVLNASAIGAYEFELFYDAMVISYLRWEPGPFLWSTGRSGSCQEIINQSTLRLGCTTFGPPPPDGPSGDGLLARLHFRPRSLGESCMLLLEARTTNVFGDTLPTVRQDGCVIVAPIPADSDGDGCSDPEELGPDPALGGARDPLSPWDFFDVPVPALTPSDASGVRNRAVTLQDVGAVLHYVGTVDERAANPNGVDYDSDLNANGVDDGREYDRTASTDPAAPWRSGPPNGSVSLVDAVVALAQVGHACTGL